MPTRTAGMIGGAVIVLMLSTGFPAVPDPSSEVCAKVREARRHQAHYLQLSSLQRQHERLVAESYRRYVEAGYPPQRVEALMGHTYRRLEDGRRLVSAAKAAYDQLAVDLIGKVEEPWPACEAAQ